jgi:hypothetical protein
MHQSTLAPFVLNVETVVSDAPPCKRHRPSAAACHAHNEAMGRFARCAATYAVPLSQLSPLELKYHKTKLTMTPIDLFARSDTVSFNAYSECDGWLHVPRWYGTEHWGAARDDATAMGTPSLATFRGELKSHQCEPTSAVLAELSQAGGPRGGMLCLGCGMGKTVCGIYVACKLGVKTLVLVHKNFLITQWAERIRQFTDARVGTIQQTRVDVDEKDIVLGMVQSVAMREYDPRIFADFGLLIVDEAHHMAAQVFKGAVLKIPSRTVLALSATPNRKVRDAVDTRCVGWRSRASACTRGCRCVLTRT